MTLGTFTTNRLAGVLAVLLLAASGCTVATQSAAPSGTAAASLTPSASAWTATGTMIEARSGHTATLLRDGTVLVTGGGQSSTTTELYEPSTGTWSVSDNMQRGRVGHTATLLLDGRVLVVAGDCAFDGGTQGSAEIYDPDSRTWTITEAVPPHGPDRFNACADHTATLLLDGRVLVAGGSGSFPDSSLAAAELYDPITGAWAVTGQMNETRHGHTATLLSDGRVLVAGGGTPSGPQDSAELYDPRGGTWTATASMHEGHARHSATLLLDDRVLVAGGSENNLELPATGPLVWAELYDPISGSWSAAAGMIEARSGHTAALLRDGKVLVVGVSGRTITPAELYDPNSESWTAIAGMIEARFGHTLTILPTGEALVVGGCCDGSGNPLASSELYDPGFGS